VRLPIAALASFVLLGSAAWGQSVALQGMLGNRALLIVDGGAPTSVAPGASHQGVKVIATRGDEAVIEVAGQRRTLRVGESPASVGGAGASALRGNRVVLTAGSGGHFTTPGAINGRATQFLVDTGATAVSLGAAEAERMGIAYRDGRPVQLGTANGVATGWLVRLASVRVGDVEVFDVEAVVGQQAMPYVLLGNSFLTRFQMRRENDQMVLERRY
jgi:aspartyl protease family protein